MKKIYKLIILLIVVLCGKSFSQICNPSGNLVIYSNYDGGIITVNCDVNIPNIKIGICTYEAAEIHITGTFSNNVTGVIYAGYDGGNDNCSLGVTTTTILNVASNINTISVYPSVGSYNPVHGNGNPNMDGCYQCDTTTNSGGVNSPDEVVYYFKTAFPGSVLRSHHTQYGCWTPTTFNISAGGNCCILPAGSTTCTPPPTPTNVTLAANQSFCAGATTTLSVNSSTTVNWYSTNTSTVVIATGNSNSFSLSAAGNYTYYAQAINSCSTSPRVPITFTVLALPTLSVSGTPSVCAGQIATLSVSGANTYSWNTSQTTSVISVSPSSTQIYTVTGTLTLGNCKATTTISVNVFTCTGLPQLSTTQLMVSIFPNPATDVVNVSASVGNKRVEICDLAGRLLYKDEIVDANFSIDVKNLSAGIYLLSIQQNGMKESRKLIVE